MKYFSVTLQYWLAGQSCSWQISCLNKASSWTLKDERRVQKVILQNYNLLHFLFIFFSFRDHDLWISQNHVPQLTTNWSLGWSSSLVVKNMFFISTLIVVNVDQYCDPTFTYLKDEESVGLRLWISKKISCLNSTILPAGALYDKIM